MFHLRRRMIIVLISGVVLFAAGEVAQAIKKDQGLFGLKETITELQSGESQPLVIGANADKEKLIKAGEDSPLAGIVGSIIGILLSFIGIVFFILMLAAGIMWMTARGNEDQEKKARELIFAAIIGMIIVVGAYALTRLVMSSTKKTADDSLSAVRQTTTLPSAPVSNSNLTPPIPGVEGT